MTLSLILTIFWILTVTALSFLPMRRQYVPGICLLLFSPVLIWMLATDFGWIAVGLFLFALVSMFRNPLRYFAKRLLNRGKGQE